MTDHTSRLTAFAFAGLLILATLAGPAAAPVSAQETTEDSEDESVVSGILPQSDERPDFMNFDAFRGFIAGAAADANPFAEKPEKANAEQYAENFKTAFNEDSDSVQNWTNNRVNATEDYEVVRIRFSDESGNSEWLFVVTDANTSTGEYQNARAMSLAEFKETNREVDLTYRLNADASRQATDELEYFVQNFADPNKDLTERYIFERVGKYQGDVDGPFIPSTSIMVLFGVPFGARRRSRSAAASDSGNTARGGA